MLKSVKIVLVSLLALLLIASIIIAVELGSLAYMLANPDEPYVAYTTERYTAQEIESLFFQHKSEFEQIAKIITNEKQFADWYNSPRIGNTNMELVLTRFPEADAQALKEFLLKYRPDFISIENGHIVKFVFNDDVKEMAGFAFLLSPNDTVKTDEKLDDGTYAVKTVYEAYTSMKAYHAIPGESNWISYYTEFENK